MKPNKAKKFKDSNQSSAHVNQVQEQPNDEVTTEDNGLDYDGVDLALQNPDDYLFLQNPNDCPPQNSYDNPHPQNPNYQSYLVYPPQYPNHQSYLVYRPENPNHQSYIVYLPQNPNHQSYLNSNHNGYYSSDGYNLFSNTNAMGK